MAFRLGSRRCRSLVLGGVALAAGISFVASTSTAKIAAGSRATSSEGDEKHILQRLDQILENQAEILRRFDQVMEELRIVKVRATQKQ